MLILSQVNSISTVCSATDSLLQIHSYSCSMKYRRGNSETLVGHIDRILASTNEVSTRFCLMLVHLKLIWQASGLFEHSHIRPAIDTVLICTFIHIERKVKNCVARSITETSYLPKFFGNQRMRKHRVPGVLFFRPSPRTPWYEAS